MDYSQIKSYFMAKEGVTITYPFGDKAEVFSVNGRKFGVMCTDGHVINIFVKCDPEEALALRDSYHSIVPGYQIDHVNWNAMIIDVKLPESLVFEQIDHSYELVTERERVLQYS